MYLNIREHADAKNYQPLNLDTGQLIKNCIWADDEKGEYCIYVRDKKGNFIIENPEGKYGFGNLAPVREIKKEIRKGRIKLVKVRES